MTAASLSVIARRFGFVREVGGPNDGTWVNFIQRFSHGLVGQSWCAYFVSLVLDIAYRGHSPLPKNGVCFYLLLEARRKGWVVGTPQVDDLFFYVGTPGNDQSAHHIGIVTQVPAFQLAGIAGNTSADGLSSNGDGVYEHALNVAPDKIVYVRLPKSF